MTATVARNESNDLIKQRMFTQVEKNKIREKKTGEVNADEEERQIHISEMELLLFLTFAIAVTAAEAVVVLEEKRRKDWGAAMASQNYTIEPSRKRPSPPPYLAHCTAPVSHACTDDTQGTCA